MFIGHCEELATASMAGDEAIFKYRDCFDFAWNAVSQ